VRLLSNSFWLFVKVVTAYTGVVIGAGFASGQEILQFFILHGYNGLFGVVLATILFAYLGGLVMFLSIKMNTTNYKKLLSYLLGPGTGKIMDLLNLLMLLGGLSVMMAGSAAVFSEQFGLPPCLGIWVVGTLTSFVILGGLEGVLTANVLLVPFKFLVIIFITTITILKSKLAFPMIMSLDLPGGVAGHWAWASFLYVSYNMVVPVAVLSSLGNSVPMKTGVTGGVAGGLLLGIAVSLVTISGLLYLPDVSFYQIPLLYMAGHLGSGFHWVLGILILMAILTTAIADAHGIASRLAPQGGVLYRLYGVGSCLLALPLAGFGFTGLVRLLYPLFGYVGLILLTCLITVPVFKFLRRCKK